MKKFMIVCMIAMFISQTPLIQAEPQALDIHYQLYAQFSPFVSAVLIKNARIEVYQKLAGQPDKFLTVGYISSSGYYYTQVNPIPQSGGVSIYFKVYATDDIAVKIMNNSVDDSTIYNVKSNTYFNIVGSSLNVIQNIDFNLDIIGAFKIYKQILDARAYFIAKANWNIYTMLRVQWNPMVGTPTVYYVTR